MQAFSAVRSGTQKLCRISRNGKAWPFTIPPLIHNARGVDLFPEDVRNGGFTSSYHLQTPLPLTLFTLRILVNPSVAVNHGHVQCTIIWAPGLRFRQHSRPDIVERNAVWNDRRKAGRRILGRSTQ